MIIMRPYRETEKEKVFNLWEICDLIRPWNDPNKDIIRKKAMGAIYLLSWNIKA